MPSGEQEWRSGRFSCTGELKGGGGLLSAVPTMCVLASLKSCLLDPHHRRRRHFLQATIIVVLLCFLLFTHSAVEVVGQM